MSGFGTGSGWPPRDEFFTPGRRVLQKRRVLQTSSSRGDEFFKRRVLQTSSSPRERVLQKTVFLPTGSKTMIVPDLHEGGSASPKTCWNRVTGGHRLARRSGSAIWRGWWAGRLVQGLDEFFTGDEFFTPGERVLQNRRVLQGLSLVHVSQYRSLYHHAECDYPSVLHPRDSVERRPATIIQIQKKMGISPEKEC